MASGFFRDYVGKPCSGRTAFEFIPRQATALALEALAAGLRRKGVAVEAETPFLVVARARGFQVSVFKNGKVLVRDTQDEGEARAALGPLLGPLHQAARPAQRAGK